MKSARMRGTERPTLPAYGVTLRSLVLNELEKATCF
jgi:hypothetical protein